MSLEEDTSACYQDLVETEISRLDSLQDFSDDTTFLTKSDIGKFPSSLTDGLFKKGMIVEYENNKYRTSHLDLIYRITKIRNREEQRPIPLEFRIAYRRELVPDYGKYKFSDILSDLLKPVSSEEKLHRVIFGSLSKSSFNGLTSYQYPVIKQIFSNSYKTVALVAPTSSGKTLSFFLPVFVYAVKRALDKSSGTSSVMIYPRKALARDQLKTFLKLIDTANEIIKKEGGNPITIGIDDGDTLHRTKVTDGQSFRKLTCMKCEKDLIIKISQNNHVVRCSGCGEYFPYILPTKQDVWEKRPTILISNVWTVYRRLMTPSTIEIFEKLDYAVVDEAHVYSHFLGGHVSYILRMLRFAANKGQPTLIFASATISNPKQFISNLSGVDEEDLGYIDFKESLQKAGAKSNRMLIHLYLLPHPASNVETLTEATLLAVALWCHRNSMKSITFIDSISEINTMRSYVHNTILGTRGGAEVSDHVFNTERSLRNDYCWLPISPENVSKDSETFRSFVMNDYKQSIQMHYGGLSLEKRARLEDSFSKGNVKLLLSTSTLELGMDLSDVGVIMQHKLPLSPEGVVQRIGRAGRNPNCYRVAFGIIVLPTLPLSTLYMFDDELRKTLEDVSFLPQLRVGHVSQNLLLQYTLSLALLKRALEKKSTYVDIGSEGVSTQEELISALREISEELKRLDSFNDKIKLLPKEDLHNSAEELQTLIGSLLQGLDQLKGRTLNQESEEIDSIKTEIDSYREEAQDAEAAIQELWSLIKDIEVFPETIRSQIHDMIENLKVLSSGLRELSGSVHAAVEKKDSRIVDAWLSKYSVVFENISKKLPDTDSTVGITIEMTKAIGSDITAFRKKYVDFNVLLRMISGIGEKLGSGEGKGLVTFLKKVLVDAKKLRSIDFRLVSTYDAFERFKSEVKLIPWGKLEIFDALTILLEGRAHFSLLLQTASPDFELVGVAE